MREFERAEREHGDAIAGRYDRDYHGSRIARRFDRDFAGFVQSHFRKGDRVLDLGCGPASLWRHWKEALGSARLLIGIDVSEGMIAECRKAYPGDDFLVGSVLDIPLAPDSVDLVIASSVLHHVPEEFLAAAVAECGRVLGEHGTLVGREPTARGRLGAEPGWLSGALMAFRHLAYRLTHTVEEPEPAATAHHRTCDPRSFVAALATTFRPKALRFRFPVSPYVLRCEDDLVVELTALLDESLTHKGGHEFYYAADKNFFTAADVARFIDNALLANELGAEDKRDFAARLVAAAELIEERLGRGR